MPIDSLHPLYIERADPWQTVSDCLAGSRKVKQCGSRYLPYLHEQENADYLAYKSRAVFFGVCARALSSYVGFVFKDNPDVQLGPDPEKPDPDLEEMLKDVTLSGRSFYDVSKETAERVFSVGRRGTLVDWNEEEKRPFLKTYEAQDIINWRCETIKGKYTLTFVMLRENADPQSYDFLGLMGTGFVGWGSSTDPYEQRNPTLWREYRLLDDGAGGYYAQVTVYAKNAESSKGGTQVEGRMVDASAEFVTVVPPTSPTRNGVPLDFIPFVFHNFEGGEADPGMIPMEDLASLNLSHYRTSADLENARHMAGVPTPIMVGFPEGQNVYLGSTRAIISENTNAKWGFLEYSSAGLSELRLAIEEKEQQMAALGARMLEKQGMGRGNVEAFETVQIRQSGEASALMTGTIACSQTLTDVLDIMVWWTDPKTTEPEELAGDYFTELNTEYATTLLDAPMATAIMQMYLNNTLTLQELFYKYQEGGIIRSETKFDDFQKDLRTSPVNIPAGALNGAKPVPALPPGAAGGPAPPAPPAAGTPPPPTKKGRSPPKPAPSTPTGG